MLTAADRAVVGFNAEGHYLCRKHAVEHYGELATAKAEVGMCAPPLTAVYGWEVDDRDDPEDTWGSYCDDCGEAFQPERACPAAHDSEEDSR